MTEETGSTGSEAIASTPLPADAPTEFTSSEQAAKYFISLKEKASETPAESAPAATAEPELPDEGNAAAAKPTGETEEGAPAEEPLRDLPRSWTKDRAEVWNRLDPAAQDILLEQDRKASAEVRRVQNEAAEERKAAKAEREAAEQVRKQYEAKLPTLDQKIQTIGPFADIKSMDDVRNLQRNDPFRFQEYQVYQWELAAEQTELKAVQDRQAQEQKTAWAQHVKAEDDLAMELIPELADEKKGPALRNRVVTELLPDLGFKQSELADLASGKSKLSLFDHRVQRLLADSVKLRDIQNASKVVAAKPVPQVQRPGTARPSGNADSERIQALTRQLNETGSLKVAQELRALQSQRRAS